MVLGQLVYGGSVTGAGVATLSTNAKTKLGTTSNSITLTNNTTATTGYAANEGIFYVASSSGSFASLGLKTGDWLISTGSAWIKIDNTDEVTSVNGSTGAVTISASDLGAYVKPSGGIPSTDLAESYYLASNPSGYTSNTGTITGVSVNGTSVATSGVAALTNIAKTNADNNFSSSQTLERQGSISLGVTNTSSEGGSGIVINATNGEGKIMMYDDSGSVELHPTYLQAGSGNSAKTLNLPFSTVSGGSSKTLATTDDIPSAITSVNGLSGGTISSTTTVNGDLIASYVKIASIGHETTSNYNKHLTLSSTNYVRYRTTAELKSDLGVPTATSDLTNDSGFITSSYHDSSKQDDISSNAALTITNNLALVIGYNATSGELQQAYIEDLGVIQKATSTTPAANKIYSGSTTALSPSQCLANGFYYVNSSSTTGNDANPFYSLHTSNTDFRILATSYSDAWVQQIATDFRSTKIFIRKKEKQSFGDNCGCIKYYYSISWR